MPMRFFSPDTAEVRAPLLKIISAWGITLFTSAWHTWQTFPWDTVGKFLAAVYTALLIYEYLSKKYKSWKVQNGAEQNLS